MRLTDERWPITLRWHDATIGLCSEERAAQFALNPDHFVDHLEVC